MYFSNRMLIPIPQEVAGHFDFKSVFGDALLYCSVVEKKQHRYSFFKLLRRNFLFYFSHMKEKSFTSVTTITIIQSKLGRQLKQPMLFRIFSKRTKIRIVRIQKAKISLTGKMLFCQSNYFYMSPKFMGSGWFI